MVTRIMVGTCVDFDTLPSPSAERAAIRQIKQHLTPVKQRLTIVIIIIKALPLRFDFEETGGAMSPKYVQY